MSARVFLSVENEVIDLFLRDIQAHPDRGDGGTIQRHDRISLLVDAGSKGPCDYSDSIEARCAAPADATVSLLQRTRPVVGLTQRSRASLLTTPGTPLTPYFTTYKPR